MVILKEGHPHNPLDNPKYYVGRCYCGAVFIFTQGETSGERRPGGRKWINCPCCSDELDMSDPGAVEEISKEDEEALVKEHAKHIS